MIKTVINRAFAEKGIWDKPLASLGLYDSFFVQSDDELTECKAKLSARNLSCKEVGTGVTISKQSYRKFLIMPGAQL